MSRASWKSGKGVIMFKKGLACVSATALFALSSTFSVQAEGDIDA